jgi:hypothetical protein
MVSLEYCFLFAAAIKFSSRVVNKLFDRLCTLTYSVRILLVNEFDNCSDDPAALENCDALLDGIGANPDDTWWYWLVLVGLFVVFRLTALFVLKYKASKFL